MTTGPPMRRTPIQGRDTSHRAGSAHADTVEVTVAGLDPDGGRSISGCAFRTLIRSGHGLRMDRV